MLIPYLLLAAALVGWAVGSSVLIIDDTDPRVAYSPAGVWTEATDSTLDLYLNTYHYSGINSAQNANATVKFTFPHPGTAFMWRGFQRSDAGMFAICIDCDDAALSTSYDVVDCLNKTSSGTDPPVTLFSISDLSDTVHNITIFNMLDPRVNTYGQITVDAFMVLVDQDISGGSTLSPTGAASSAAATTTISYIPTALSASFPSASALATPVMSILPAGAVSTSSLTRGEVAGISIGAIGAVILLIVFFLLCWRMIRRPAEATSEPVSPAKSTPGTAMQLWRPSRLSAVQTKIFGGSKQSREPIPFILPAPSTTPDPIARWRDESEEARQNAQSNYPYSNHPPSLNSDNIPSGSNPRQTAQAPYRGWPSTTSVRTEEPTLYGLTNASMSTVAGSLMTSPTGTRRNVTFSPTDSRATTRYEPDAPLREEDAGFLQGAVSETESVPSPVTYGYDTRKSPGQRFQLGRSVRRAKGPRPLSTIPQSPGASRPP